MSDTALRAELIRLAHQHPEFKDQILPLLTSKKATGMFPEALIRKMKKQTASNFHTEALLTLAEGLGHAKYIKIMGHIKALHDLEGSMPYGISLYRTEVYKELMRFAESRLSPEDIAALRNAF